MLFSEIFREARGARTQTAVAALLSGPTKADACPVATVRDWEQGRREPPRWMQALILGQLMRADLRARKAK